MEIVVSRGGQCGSLQYVFVLESCWFCLLTVWSVVVPLRAGVEQERESLSARRNSRFVVVCFVALRIDRRKLRREIGRSYIGRAERV